MGYSAQSLSQFATNSFNKQSEVSQLWTPRNSQRNLDHPVSLPPQVFKRTLILPTAQSAVASFPERLQAGENRRYQDTQNDNLWKSFSKIGNEMIVTKPGR